MLQSMGSELDTTQGLNNNKYFYKIILLLTHTLSHIHVLFIHCVALRAPSTLCFLCLNGCLWPLGDPVEPPHSIFVCVCVCVCVCHTAQLVGFWFPDQRSNRGPQQQKHRVLTIGPPGNSYHSPLYSQRQPRIHQIELNRCSLKKLTVLTVDPERNS